MFSVPNILYSALIQIECFCFVFHYAQQKNYQYVGE